MGGALRAGGYVKSNPIPENFPLIFLGGFADFFWESSGILYFLEIESGTYWIGLKKWSTALGFWFFNLVLNFWRDFKVLSRFIQKRIQPLACSDRGLCGHKPRSFPLTSCSKNAGKPLSSIVLWMTARE
jgi:hypothetical protein